MHFQKTGDVWTLYFSPPEMAEIWARGYLLINMPGQRGNISIADLQVLSNQASEVFVDLRDAPTQLTVARSTEAASTQWVILAVNGDAVNVLATCATEHEANLEAQRLANEHGYSFTASAASQDQPGDQDVSTNRVFMGSYWVEFPTRRMCDYLSAAVLRGADPEYQCRVSNDTTSQRFLVEAFPALLSSGGAPERRYEPVGLFYQTREAFDYANRLAAELRLIPRAPLRSTPNALPPLPNQEKPMIRSRRRTML